MRNSQTFKYRKERFPLGSLLFYIRNYYLLGICVQLYIIFIFYYFNSMQIPLVKNEKKIVL